MAKEVESLEELSKTLLEEIPKRNNNYKISGIPAFIEDNHTNPYQPQIVQIGPYRRNEEHITTMDGHKLRYLSDFLKRPNPQIDLDAYVNAMCSAKDDARKYYSDNILLSDYKFVKMLILDGCFILELVLKLQDNKNCRPCWTGCDFMTILSDLLLIENQIPFFVLENLYAVYLKGLEGPKSKTSDDSDLKSLVVNNLFVPYLGSGTQPSRVRRQQDYPIDHLLHLYHEISLPNPQTEKESGKVSAHSTVQRKNNYSPPLVIPSASQLLEFGFVLRKQDSTNNCEATFKHSTIRIPRLIIDSTRKTLLMNLLAFEHGLEVTRRRWTGLMVMMNCLLKNKRDFEILHRSGIVLNLLPTEDETIEFFSQLSKRVTIDFNDHYFWDLFEQVNRKCDAYLSRKRAKLMHEYFKNPWAFISFFSSIAAILLSLVQTYVSVFTYRRRFH